MKGNFGLGHDHTSACEAPQSEGPWMLQITCPHAHAHRMLEYGCPAGHLWGRGTLRLWHADAAEDR